MVYSLIRPTWSYPVGTITHRVNVSDVMAECEGDSGLSRMLKKRAYHGTVRFLMKEQAQGSDRFNPDRAAIRIGTPRQIPRDRESFEFLRNTYIRVYDTRAYVVLNVRSEHREAVEYLLKYGKYSTLVEVVDTPQRLPVLGRLPEETN